MRKRLSVIDRVLVLTGEIGEGRKKPAMYMVTPYMEHDLSGLLENPSVQFTEPQIKCYMMQLLEGLRYLHEVWQNLLFTHSYWLYTN